MDFKEREGPIPPFPFPVPAPFSFSSPFPFFFLFFFHLVGRENGLRAALAVYVGMTVCVHAYVCVECMHVRAPAVCICICVCTQVLRVCVCSHGCV